MNPKNSHSRHSVLEAIDQQLLTDVLREGAEKRSGAEAAVSTAAANILEKADDE